MYTTTVAEFIVVVVVHVVLLITTTVGCFIVVVTVYDSYCVYYDFKNIYREEGRDHKKGASILLKIGYVIVQGMDMNVYAPILCASKPLWVNESSEVRNFCYEKQKK